MSAFTLLPILRPLQQNRVLHRSYQLFIFILLTLFGLGLRDAQAIGLGSIHAPQWLRGEQSQEEQSSTPVSQPPSAEHSETQTSPFVGISDRLVPTVVNIYTAKVMPGLQRHRSQRTFRGPQPYDEFWNQFFFGQNDPQNDPQNDNPGPYGAPLPQYPGGPGPQLGADQPQQMSLGSGFIIETAPGEALIATNNHVVNGADKITVRFTESTNEQDSPAELLGTDADLDVALLRVKTKRQLQAVTLGDSDRLKVGEWIAAIGNPFGHGHSVSHGIVSAKARTLPGAFGRFLQVDAPINPGNSGGPLVNMRGEVVGINTAIDARGAGIGFAIPAKDVKASLAQLKAHGSVERGYIGVSLAPHQTENGAHPLVMQVVPGGPAARAGVRNGDEILAVDDHTIHSPEDMVELISQASRGTSVKLKLLRQGQTTERPVRIDRRPTRLSAQR